MTKSGSRSTAAQSLGALLKSTRDTVRKVKGRDGGPGHLPMLTRFQVTTLRHAPPRIGHLAAVKLWQRFLHGIFPGASSQPLGG
jgi:hypothetical protein